MIRLSLEALIVPRIQLLRKLKRATLIGFALPPLRAGGLKGHVSLNLTHILVVEKHLVDVSLIWVAMSPYYFHFDMLDLLRIDFLAELEHLGASGHLGLYGLPMDPVTSPISRNVHFQDSRIRWIGMPARETKCPIVPRIKTPLMLRG